MIHPIKFTPGATDFLVHVGVSEERAGQIINAIVEASSVYVSTAIAIQAAVEKLQMTHAGEYLVMGYFLKSAQNSGLVGYAIQSLLEGE